RRGSAQVPTRPFSDFKRSDFLSFVTAQHPSCRHQLPSFFASQNCRIIPEDCKEPLMAEKLTWDDAAKIGVLLSRKHPELYPLSTNLEELHRRVTNLPEFKDDVSTFDKNKLEAIRTAWNDEFLNRTQ